MKKNNSGHPFKRQLKGFWTLFFVGLILLVTQPAWAQTGQKPAGVKVKNITLNMQNVPLKQILSALQKQSSLNFLYNTQIVDVNQTMSLAVKDEDIVSVLEKLLTKTTIGFRVEDNQIILAQKSVSTAPDIAQTEKDKVKSDRADNQVKGYVVDEAGMPISGATVMLKGTTVGTATNIDGFFTLASKGKGTLVASFIGYISAEVTIDGTNSYTIVLDADFKRIDEVVVTGYQTLSKERSTGSFNLIKSDQIEKPTSNIGQRLLGAASGIQATTDEDGNMTFEIRGQSSLYTGTTSPLIVVDGFAIQGDISTINPNDVENITILKDAAAASIWGARSANGVIVITTKSGAAIKESIRVDFSSFVKVGRKVDVNYLYPYATSTEVIDYEKKGFSSNFFGSFWSPISDGNSYSSLQSGYSAAVTAMNEHRLGYISDDELNETLNHLSKIDNRKQIKDHLFQDPFTHQYNLNISGGTVRMSNNLSIMFEGNKLNYKGKSNKKYMISYRNSVKAFKWLDFNFGGTFGMTDRKNNEEIYSSSPYHSLFNEDGSRADVPHGYYMPNMKRYVPMQNFPYGDWSYNPISEMESRDFRTNEINARVQAGLTFKLLKGLSFDSKIMYERISTSVKNITDESSFWVRGMVNETSSWNQYTNEVTANLPKGSFLDQNRSLMQSYSWRNQLSFNREFKDIHQVSAVAGIETYEVVNQSYINPTTYGYDNDRLTVGTFPNGPTDTQNWMGFTQYFEYTNGYGYSTDRYFSAFANASYTYDRKYTVSASARTDASNMIADDPSIRYSPFWSVGASWVISNEDFMSNISRVNRLMLRATYGYNGNVNTRTSVKPLINMNATQDIYINDFTASIGQYGNPDLRWERTGNMNVGLDFDLFNGKLFGKFDVYNKKGKDLMVQMSMPAVQGTTIQYLNQAEMTNRGVEVELGTNLKIANGISWSGNLNFSYNKNKIDKLFKTTYASYDLYDGGTTAYVQGFDANTLWSYQYLSLIHI